MQTGRMKRDEIEDGEIQEDTDAEAEQTTLPREMRSEIPRSPVNMQGRLSNVILDETSAGIEHQVPVTASSEPLTFTHTQQPEEADVTETATGDQILATREDTEDHMDLLFVPVESTDVTGHTKFAAEAMKPVNDIGNTMVVVQPMDETVAKQKAPAENVIGAKNKKSRRRQPSAVTEIEELVSEEAEDQEIRRMDAGGTSIGNRAISRHRNKKSREMPSMIRRKENKDNMAIAVDSTATEVQSTSRPDLSPKTVISHEAFQTLSAHGERYDRERYASDTKKDLTREEAAFIRELLSDKAEDHRPLPHLSP